LFFLSGSGKAILDGVESVVMAGDAVVVTPGTEHNFINDGSEPLKVYTIYTPPNHIDGRVHVTKADADADTADEEFGHAAR
ncbi:MAG: cupin domain-containing protein, partial [Patescibacteria group bacterium]